jgi:hypothetical protein
LSRSISRYGFEKVITNEEGKPMFRRCITHDGKGTRDIPVEEKGFVKELEVKVIIRKRYFSEVDYEAHTAYFVQKYKLSMPTDRALEFVYFKYDAKSMGNVCVRDFRNEMNSQVGTGYLGTTWIDLFSPNDSYMYGIKKVGRAVKVSEQKAKVMLREHEVIGLYSKSGENIV